ncbi:MAG TPA: hypothetical protein VFT64_07425 [Rickettsiales bacterium]|nr:hypothetical protein [Rickettsiales bacterium]
MTRIGYFLFNLLLVVVIYAMVWLNPKPQDAMLYAIQNFSVPYIVLTFLMAFASLLSYFIAHNDDVAKQGMTFLHGCWMSGLATFIAYKLISTHDLAHLFSHLR